MHVSQDALIDNKCPILSSPSRLRPVGGLTWLAANSSIEFKDGDRFELGCADASGYKEDLLFFWMGAFQSQPDRTPNHIPTKIGRPFPFFPMEMNWGPI